MKQKTSYWLVALLMVCSVVFGGLTGYFCAFYHVKSSQKTFEKEMQKEMTASIDENVKKEASTAAKNAVKGIIDKITGFFSGMKLELPKIKLPHFKISGKLSLSPPSVPHLSIDWYKEGGILTKPTVFGMNGSSLMAGGEAGKEAVLPLKGFYDQLEHILSSRMNTGKMEQYLAVIANNSSKGIYLEDGTLVDFSK